ncbi:MAG: ABC transporter permease [Alphaproteobacteria bacterium]|nr:ABC transporter permease [Alphaproteobacteria bacterium]
MMGVAMGVGFSIAMASLMEGSQRDFITRIVDNMPHIVIKDEFRANPLQPVDLLFQKGAVELKGLKPKDEIRGIKAPWNKIEALEALPGLKVAPTLSSQIFLSFGGKDVSATLLGIDVERERQATSIEADIVTEGGLDSLHTAANGLILGRGLAAKLGAQPNDTLTATSASGVVMKMKVVGLFHTGIISVDSSQSYALLKKAQILADRPNVINLMRIKMSDPMAAVDMALMLESRWGYKSESWQESNEGLLGAFAIRNAVMYITVSAILIVASFGIFNVVSTVVYEKTRDIAILRSMGFEPSDIKGIFLLEGFLVGLLGALLGWGLGFGLCQILGMVRFNIKMMTEVQGFILHSTWIHYTLSGAVAATSATLASYLPARKASRLKPVDTIRGAA